MVGGAKVVGYWRKLGGWCLGARDVVEEDIAKHQRF